MYVNLLIKKIKIKVIIYLKNKYYFLFLKNKRIIRIFSNFDSEREKNNLFSYTLSRFTFLFFFFILVCDDFQFLIQDWIIMKKSKQLPSNNLFNNHQRNLPKSSNATLPIINLSSFANFKQKFNHMATNNNNNNKPIIPTTNMPTDIRMAHIKSSTKSFNRPYASSMPKSSLSYPIAPYPLDKQQQYLQNSRYLYFVKTPTPRALSSRIPAPLLASSQQTNFPRPYNQYGHFLTYLRRQSLARIRRKQQEEEGNTDHIETTITFNSNKQSSTQSFQSTSNYSLISLTANTTSMPMISMTAKRAGRPLSSVHTIQRSLTNYRLNSLQQSSSLSPTPTPIIKNSIDNHVFPLTSSSLLITPRNSVNDEVTMPPIRIPYDFNFNDDIINYNKDIKYQGQTLSTVV